MKKILLNPLWAFATLVLLISTLYANFSFVESVKLRYFDTLIISKAPVQNNIYTVNIDEAALDKWGQWPFPRTVYSELIQDLYKRGAGLVVFNVLMPEKDRFGGDVALAKSLNQLPVVLANTTSEVTKNTPKNPGAVILGKDYIDTIPAYPGITANMPQLEDAAAGVGLTNTMPEIDGVNRRLPLIASVDGTLYPNLSLEILRVIAGDPNFQIKLNENGVEKMRIPKFGIIPTDSLGRVWIDWSQESKSVSAADLPNDFEGAVVIVGVSAAGIANPVPTAKGAMFTQDVQAAALATMVNNSNIQRPDWAPGAELIFIVVFGSLIILLSRWTYVGLGTTALGIVAPVAVSYYGYANWGYLGDATASTVCFILVALHVYGIKFVSEFLQKQQIKKQFGTYLSPAMVEKLQKNPDLLKLGGESRELSIMFTDVRGFTTISEHYGSDVQGLTKIMNRYMTAMTAKIIENEGTLDKYIGDAQMAFWNAPLDDPDHAKHAVATALQMMESLDAFNREVTAEGIPAFGMGLGINTDTVVVGNMGSVQRFDYTCLGDGVNLASRLEGQSKPYGVKIVLGPKTYEYVKNDYVCIELDCLAVKGKTQGVNIYTIVDAGSVKPPALTTHQYFLDYYRSCNWDEAISYANILKKAFDGELLHYYENMIERIEEYKINHPGVYHDGDYIWDGVYRTNSK